MFERGKEYHRGNDIHEVYGGNRQSGISKPQGHPYVFLFAAKAGETFGYTDGWIGADLYRYTGEGQRGDMVFERGNRRIRDHEIEGNELHLFVNSRPGMYRYHGSFAFDSFEVRDSPDIHMHLRKAIVFTLRRFVHNAVVGCSP